MVILGVLIGGLLAGLLSVAVGWSVWPVVAITSFLVLGAVIVKV